MLAIFGQISGAKLALNELGETRREILAGLFPQAPISGHDAASIDDRLDRSIQPSLILMNPPFSAAPNVEGRFKHTTSQHVLSALARLKPGGRLILISGASFNPTTRAFQSTFIRIAETANVVFSCPIAGRVFAKHGTTIDTRLTVIDKHQPGDPKHAIDPDVFYPISETLSDVLETLGLQCPKRQRDTPTTQDGANAAPKPSAHSIRDAARRETQAIAAERAKHPFDSVETIKLDYLPKSWADPTGSITEAVYEDYELQAFTIEGAASHPTALVQSAAMASVSPPMPKHRPVLPKALIEDGVLSGPQLESVIYAGDVHATHLKGFFKRGELEGQLVAARDDDEDTFRLRKGWFLGDGTGCGKGRQVAGIILDNWMNGRKRSVWITETSTVTFFLFY